MILQNPCILFRLRKTRSSPGNSLSWTFPECLGQRPGYGILSVTAVFMSFWAGNVSQTSSSPGGQ